MSYAGGDKDDKDLDKIKKGSKSPTPLVDYFGRDISYLVKMGLVDPVIGRDKEINKAIQILSKRNRRNVLIVGDPGVGKTAIVEGLAHRIFKKEVDISLQNKRVVELNIGSIVSGTKYRGQFEERMDEIIGEITSNPELIVFIDEIHNIIGAGSTSGNLDAGDILKPYLSRGEINCIGATTLNEYKKHIEQDSALDRRFQKVYVDEPSKDETLIILNKIKDKYETFHNVTYSDEVLKNCVELTSRYITSRKFPDKAIDIMDEVGSYVKLNNSTVPSIITELDDRYREIDARKKKAATSQQYEVAAKCRDEQRQILKQIDDETKKWNSLLSQNKIPCEIRHVAHIISSHTGIPTDKIEGTEKERLINLDLEIKKRIVGQDNAIEKVADSIRRSRVGIQDPNKPIASFMFLGPTGTGKTELCKELAKFLFDSEQALIKIDMSEYMDKASVSKMVGSPPGYVGYDEKGQLTEKIKNKPYSVILFDEIEKAHPEVFDILLQVLDEGRLTDSTGTEVNFKNSIIIMTSNIGTSNLISDKSKLGFPNKSVVQEQQVESMVMAELEKKFRPEFLNRIDDIVVFNPLRKENILEIVKIHVDDFANRLKLLGYSVKISSDVYDFLSEVGYDKKYGVRPLKRAIRKHLETSISSAILHNKISTDKQVKITIKDNTIIVK